MPDPGSDRSGVGPSVADVGERELLRQIARIVDAAPQATETIVGIGDDAAVIRGAASMVVTTDALVDGAHFRLDWCSPVQVGRRAVIANAADVAAMGGRTTACVAAIAAPPSTPARTVLGIVEGLAQQCADIGAAVAGGDLVAAAQIVVTVTAVGQLDGDAVLLSGARDGQRLAVSGPIGAAAAGLAVLSAGVDGFDDLTDRYRVPPTDLAAGVRAGEAGAAAMTDVSDGLAGDALALATASGVRLRIDPERIPVHPSIFRAAEVLGRDPLGWVLGATDDHVLLAAFPGPVPSGWTVIGDVAAGDPRVDVVGVPDPPDGWHSF
ncbi:thiamine-phosphate kinase [Jongsikchunia kroppenstedtii]|uniref:thiamine-phosphate kinase n=1 Tax=Jongsikchunia kroppenstedtii TaxID=1121721 RepID=UPI00037C3F72|nr:thiamine-phosphate kinase [Jongsikchunia kroppenstedtii]